MDGFTTTPARAFWTGLALVLVVALIWLAAWGDEYRNVYLPGIGHVLLRIAHVLAAMIWVGLIWYVNFVQLVAVEAMDEVGRTAVHKEVAPRVAFWFRHMATLTVLTGIGLIFSTEHMTLGGIAAPKGALLLVSALLGIVMLGFVHAVIWPGMQVILGLRAGDAAAKQAARRRVKRFARLNLILAIPTTAAMVGAAHLY
ncbi:MAG: hypothetical protein R3D57_11375 [Hyphomicrobiaceae bacterium]